VHTSNGASAEASAAASAVEELSASIGSISQQLKTTTRLVGTAVLEANVADTEISDLAQSAVKIDDIVKIIREIAEQTNLLALNATIEAARAGEAGKGFAVVASEVKSLAVQTAKATEQIATQISTVKNSAAAAVNAIHRNADRMQDINQHTAAVAKSVEEQNAATGEISFNVANATTGTRAIRETLDEVNLAAIKTQESAQTLLGASRSVETAVNLLQNKVVGFLQKVAV
jgi:methyl-accepting chemotaxis protein